MSKDSANFMFGCKNLYQLGIDPLDPKQQETSEYRQLVDKGIELLNENGIQSFLNLLMESQYKVSIWAAMISLEYGDPKIDDILSISGTETIISSCLRKIERKPLGLTKDQEDNYDKWLEKMRTHYNKR